MISRRLAVSLFLIAGGAVALGGCAALVGARAAEREAAAEARYPPTGRIVEIGGQRVHAHVEGAGPDLVLIHGASGNLRDFTFDLAGRLSGDFRVIAFDRPGLGWTEPLPDGGIGPQEQAELLRAAADALGVRRPVVVGHSYGGAVALAWGLQSPTDTAALVILAGASHPWEGPLSLSQTVPATALGRLLINPLVTAFAGPDAVDGALRGVFRPQAVPEGYRNHIGAGLTLRRDALRRNAEQLAGLKPHLAAMAPRYPELPMPVEIVHGTADRTVGLQIHAERLAEDVPQAALTRLEGVGHMPHHVAPEAVVAAIHRAAERAGLR
jgi:pimeloyl-ACP methyl ester carboxylesterase